MKCFILYFATIFVVVSAVEVEDCGSQLGSFSNVSITNCDDPDQSVCILKKGTNVTINIQFTTNVEVKTVKAVVHGIIQGLPVPYPIPHSDGCTKSGLNCPLAKGEPEDYFATFTVQHSYPAIHLTVKWELKNEAGDDILCIDIPTKIK